MDIIAPDRSALLELTGMLQQAIDPDGRIPAAMQAVGPLEGQTLLEVGAGPGDRSLRYASLASHVYALERDPQAFAMLRGRIKSAGVTNITALQGGPESIPLETGAVSLVYATWTAAFGAGGEAALEEVERVTRSGGKVVIVENYGHDHLSRFWTEAEARCESWLPWFEARGYACRVVETVWRFPGPAEAQTVLGALWGAGVQDTGQVEFQYRVAVYHKQVLVR